MVVDAVTPDFDAVHVLRTALAVNGPGPTFFTEAELVADRLPFVLTRSSPLGGRGAFGSFGGRPPKMTAGPYWAMAPPLAVATTAVDDPPCGKLTDGLALPLLAGGMLWPHPCTVAGPPKRLTSVL
jgi:hypothetical protein